MDQELRDWLKSLAQPEGVDGTVAVAHAPLSEEAADYLVGIATDGTLTAALAELAASDPELAG